jgi:hypothetical protein
MGPVEIVFITLIIFFGIVGIVRGYHRELGVTMMLLLALLLIQLADTFFANRVNAFLGALFGDDNLSVTKAILYTILLAIVVFVTYQGETLVFPGTGNSPILSFVVGALNGYLFAGTVWYFMQAAGWAGLPIRPPFTEFYNAAVRLLPPAVLTWPFLLLMVTIMLILRVWR